MTTHYYETKSGEIWRYYYDRSLRLWTAYPIDSEGNQLQEADHFGDKKQLRSWLFRQGRKSITV